MMAPFMAGDWLSMHPLGNPGIVVPNIDIKKYTTTISKSETTTKIEKLKAIRVLTDKRLLCG